MFKIRDKFRLVYIFTNRIDIGHPIIEGHFEKDDIEKGPGIWRLNNKILEANENPTHARLSQWSGSLKDYDSEKQRLRERNMP